MISFPGLRASRLFPLFLAFPYRNPVKQSLQPPCVTLLGPSIFPFSSQIASNLHSAAICIRKIDRKFTLRNSQISFPGLRASRLFPLFLAIPYRKPVKQSLQPLCVTLFSFPFFSFFSNSHQTCILQPYP